MKDVWKQFSRGLALALVLAFLLLPVGAVTAGAEGGFDIILQWTDAWGSPQSAPATQVAYDGFQDCYWAMVPAGTPLDGLSVQITDPTNTYASFSVPSGSLLPGMADAGTSLLTEQRIEIMAFTPEGNPGALIYLYVSTQAFTPEPPVELPTEAPTPVPTPVPVQPVDVTVHYVDENGQQVATDTFQRLEEGTWPVFPAPYDLPVYYDLVGDNTQQVTVTAEGAFPAEVTFVYRYNPPATEVPTPVPVQPVDVTVHYVDENGQQVATDTFQRLEEGTWPVFPAPYDLPVYYDLVGDNTQQVTVTAEGAFPAEVTFVYRYNPPATEVPTPVPVQPVDVTVHYVDENGQQVATDTFQRLEEGTWPVFPAPYDLPVYYDLVGDNTQQVTVTAEGAFPAEVTFVYRYNPPATEVPTPVPVQPVDVTVHYVDENGQQVATDTFQRLEEGTWPVFPAPYDLPVYYDLVGDNTQQVTVTAEGAFPAEVTFVYRYNPPATEVPTPVPVQPVDVTVHYVDENSQQVATDTFQRLEEGTWPVFPAPYDLPVYYDLVGDNTQQVTVTAEGAFPAEVTFVYRYNPPATEVPTEAPTQEPTQQPTPVPQPALVTVEYLNWETGLPVASQTTVSCDVGAVTAVLPAPVDLLPDYVLVSDPIVSVTVDENGQPDQASVQFLYQYQPPETEAPTEAPTESPTEAPTETPAETPTPTPIPVPVYYLSQDGQPVATEGEALCAYGDTRVAAAPVDLAEDYVLEGEDAVIVHVDENGANPAAVIFTYRYDPNVPAPKIALVGVKYVRPSGESFFAYTETCVQGAENRIAVDMSKVEEEWNYELASPAEVFVTVDDNGAATPAEVVFQFKNEVNAYVAIRFQDAATGREVATAQQQLCYVGDNVVNAAPADLEDRYQLTGESQRTVHLDENGTLTPAEVVFSYEYLPTPSPDPNTPTPPPVDEPMDGYCYPTGNNINFRSTPNTADQNVIGTVGTGDLAHILGKVTNPRNEVWYAVEINGQKGYLKATVVRVLTEAEIAALFNYTLAPTQAPTPAPSPIPDGVFIDRWATTNAKVYFRKTPEVINGKNTNRIDELRKNTRVWVYSSQTANSQKWYYVRYNGVDGYIMADYVNLASEAESQLIQQTLASPMPTQRPEATEVPVTPVPATETPVPATDAPTPSPTPAPYRGYALTLGQSALRTGVSQTDDSILQMMQDRALVYVSGQTYVEGVAWSSVQAMDSGNYGFMLDAALLPITNEEARPYLDQLQPVQQATPSPVPEQVYGYAMTMGDGVPMRTFPDTNAEIMQLLPYSAIANVRGQSYAGGMAWHMVQYNGMWGFIREDQLRMLSTEESLAYEESLRAGTPTPSPAPTPEPVTQASLSSYGHVVSSSGRVNLRSAPNKDATRIRLLDNYAFALVLGTETDSQGNTWYHVSQAGTEGYIAGDYFKVLSIGELTTFLQSNEYQNANSNNGASTVVSSSAQIQPVEDYNKTVWKNPALSASYEPFNPYLTPTPDPERLYTPTPTPAPEISPSPTPEIAPVETLAGMPTPDPISQQGGSAWPWVLLGLAAVGGGGAYYAYTIHRSNERRRQAVRAQQARQARAAAQPQMRTAQNNPGQGGQPNRAAYPNQQQSAAPFMPPQGGAPRPAQTPASTAQRPGGVSQNTNPYRPISQRTVNGYQAPHNKPAAPDAGETQAYRPVQPAQQAQPDAGATQAYRPVQSGQTGPSASQATQAFRPVQPGQQPQNNSTASSGGYQRQRRADRHRDQYPGDDA